MIKSSRSKYHGVSQWPEENGLNYDKDIDSAIFSELSYSDTVGSGELKRRIESVLHRTVNRRTYYNHLRTLSDDGLLDKKDTGVRGKQSVFYSLSPDAKRRKRLHLLRTDRRYDMAKHGYANLLFRYFGSKSIVSKEDIKTHMAPVLEELLRDGLIKSKNNARYIIVDKALSNLIKDISELNKMGGNGRSPLIMGYQCQLGAKTPIEEEIHDDNIIANVDEIKKKQEETLATYSFLSDVIQIFCPLLYPQLPYREIMSSW
jgi:DNA-binding PadR family transcriptional regulator